MTIPLWVLLFGTLLVNVGFLWFEVQITARILGVFFVAEVLVSLVFAFAVLLQGGDNGLSASPLNPLELVDNTAAIAAFGAAAPGIALFGAFWSYVGFEMGPNYSEETRQRTRVLSRATYATLIILGIFYVFVTYAFVTGYGLDGTGPGVTAQFEGETASAWYPLTDRYVGASLTTAFEALIITSAFACQLAFFNTGARYLYAMGREGILPKRLGGRTASTRRRTSRARPLRRCWRSTSWRSISTTPARMPRCSSSAPGARSSASSASCSSRRSSRSRSCATSSPPGGSTRTGSRRSSLRSPAVC
ncbi:MAG: APC family permease [Actinomycetota bacterium]|nr:APC family permease [Actinomycetota bacterium]